MLSQFTPLAGHETLAKFGLPKGIYPCGRLDNDSEGLLVLTDDGALQHRLNNPKFSHPRTYLAQVERIPATEALSRLEAGVRLNDGRTRPCRVSLLESEPVLSLRQPPIRYRKNVPTAWIKLILTEGRNRQVRRMTAHVGHPTLRLVRISIGPYKLQGLRPGQWTRA